MKEKILITYSNILNYLEIKRKIIIWVSAIVYKVALDLYYILSVSSVYDYEGLIYEGKGWKYILSWIIYIFLTAILPKKQEGIKETFLHLQFVITIAPLTVFYFAADQSTSYFMMVTFVVVLEIYILCKGSKKTIGININSKIRPYISVFMMAFVIGMYIIIMLYGGFFGLKAFDLSFLYMIRSNASYPFIMEYINGWMPIIIQFFILFYLENRKYIFAVVFFIMELLLYMTLGHKVIYLSLVVIICVYIAKRLRVLIPAIYTGISGICIIVTMMFMIEKPNDISTLTSLMNSLLGERFLFGPALNKFLYYDCFSEYPKIYFSDGLIGKCFGLSNPYKGSMGQTVFAYLNDGRLFESNSNTGYLGDSYGQAGFVGMIITGILLAMFVKLICNIGENLGNAMMCSLMALLAVSLNDSAFISLFLTSGWAILLVLLIIYANPNIEVYKRRNYEY